MTHQELVYTEKYKGFDIHLYQCEEQDDPCWSMEEKDKAEIYEKIENGQYIHFCAKVSAGKNGIELANDYLGGCIYKDIRDFLADGYFTDMRETVVKEATQAIKDLSIEETEQ